MEFIFYDVEITQNHAFVGLYRDDRHVILDLHNEKEQIAKLFNNSKYVFVGYNNFKYDNFVIRESLNDKNNEIDNMTMNDNAIRNNKNVYNIGNCNNVADLFKVGSIKGSLKTNAFYYYDYVYKESLTDDYETLKRYNLEDLKLTKKLFNDKYINEFKKELKLIEFLGFKNMVSSNLAISTYLKGLEYNEWDYKYDLNKLPIDKDLKESLYKEYENKPYIADMENEENPKTKDKGKVKGNEVIPNIRTKEGYLLCKGGLHYPTNKDRKLTGLKLYNDVYEYDFASFYPNIYIKHLTFFTEEIREFLKEQLDYRLSIKHDKSKKSEAGTIKLFLNSIFGTLKFINKNYADAVALTGQGLIIQTLRDNNIDMDDIIEINTDGVVLNKKIGTVKNNTNIALEEAHINKLTHKSSNDKIKTINDDTIIKGNFFNNININDKLNIVNLANSIYTGKPIYNCFIAKLNKKFKYFKFKNIEDLKFKYENSTTLLNKTDLKKYIEDGAVQEIKEFNKEDITTEITTKFNQFIKNSVKDINKTIELKNNNDIFKRFENSLYMVPKKGKKNYAGVGGDIEHTNCKVHNYYKFLNYKTGSTIGIIPHNTHVVVDVDDENEHVKCLFDEYKTKTLMVESIRKDDKEKVSYKLIFKRPQGKFDISIKKVDGVEFLTFKKIANICGSGGEGHKYELKNLDYMIDLPSEFYTMKSTTITQGNHSTNKKINNLNRLNKEINTIISTKINFQFDGKKYVSPCGFDHTGGNSKSLVFFINNDGIIISCFANNCKYNDYTSDENKQLKDIIKKHINDDMGRIGAEDKPMNESKELVGEKKHQRINFTMVNILERVKKRKEKLLYTIGDHDVHVGQVAIISAKGGLGKSTLMLTLLLQLVTKRENLLFNNVKVKRDINALLISIEDDDTLISEKLLKIITVNELNTDELNTFADDFHVEVQDDNISIGDVFISNLQSHIKTYNYNVVVVDTLSQVIGDDTEMDNAKATRFMQEVSTIAKKYNCLIFFIHHTNKHSEGENSISGASRGASAIVNTARLSYVLKPAFTKKSGVAHYHKRKKIDELLNKIEANNVMEFYTEKSNNSLEGLTRMIKRDKEGILTELTPEEERTITEEETKTTKGTVPRENIKDSTVEMFTTQ